MTNVKPIIKSIEIEAPREQVWKTIFGKDNYSILADEFLKGATADGNWSLGNKIKFGDSNNLGLIGEVTECVPQEVLIIKYTGIFEGESEDYESEDAKMMIDTVEKYIFEEHHDITTLMISSGMGEKYFDEMNQAWSRALKVINGEAEISL